METQQWIENGSQVGYGVPDETQPVGRGTEIAAREDYHDQDGLIRRLQILQAALQLPFWCFTPSHIVDRQKHIAFPTVDKHAARMSEQDVLIPTGTVLTDAGHESNWGFTPAVGNDYACSMAWRFAKTLLEDPRGYGPMAWGTVDAVYSDVWNLSLSDLYRRYESETVRQHAPLRRFDIPEDAYRAYGI